MALYTPPLGFHFRVTFGVEGATERDIGFREVAGLAVDVEEETVNEGGENRFAHKLPVRATFQPITLKRGLLVDTGLKTWIEDAIYNLQIVPVTVWVTLLNEMHESLRTYVVHGARPKKWEISALAAESSEIVVETLELSYNYFEVA